MKKLEFRDMTMVVKCILNKIKRFIYTFFPLTICQIVSELNSDYQAIKCLMGH